MKSWNYFRNTIGLLVILLSICSCSKDEELIESTPKRTMLIYMAGDNSLSGTGYQNIQSILKGINIATLNGGNLLIYFDSKLDPPVLLQVKESKNESLLDTLQVYPEQNSVDVSVMREVIDKVLYDFPAENYGLVLWSHGTAWLPYKYSNMLRSFGEDNGAMMEIEELAEALPDKTFDFILFDACYMASIEVLYELRTKADYIIASPTEILSAGFPYQTIIQQMFSSTPDLEGICQSFYDFYNGQQGLYRSGSVSLSATAELDDLAGIVREILYEQKDAISQLPTAEIQALDYLSSRYHLLYDFDDFIAHLATPEQYEAFTCSLEKVVLYKASTPEATFGISGNPQITIDHFSGLSVYLPQSGFTTLNDWYHVHTAWGKAIYGD